ncbi:MULTISPECIES: hypothetical protein [Anaerostipes]|uniref:Uncharacterized protein n=1 Tax=Anaerostipes butyraticus TaxID=645466 RepID=A0A916Q7F3_9FIRM|nr:MULTISPECIES: hypothetical protein [Anaerostipes]GFO85592.1 hypothetical protein ANBU17_19390 [Anaerostipes butyraticus]HJC83049.1 hypothetical protein [Candidatus Anaerostipes avicola]
MKRVCAIAVCFFGIGLVTGLFISHDFTQIILCIVCMIMGYCLFFY